jgi:molybdenum cofactor synthesis domain-containing protein
MSKPWRESPYPMIALDEAQRIVAAHALPLTTEYVNSLAAEGRILAEDIVAAEAMPDVPKSTVDGYALRSADGIAERRVLAELSAGTEERVTVTPGTAAPIMTGAPLPPGADTVVMVEYTHEQDGMLRLQQAPAAGKHIRAVGEDMGQGESVLPHGTALGAAEIGLVAAIGHTRALVYRRPRVTVLSTGNELVEPEAPRRPGQVRDSNCYALLAAIRAAGGDAHGLGIVRDDPDAQRQALQRGIAEYDVLLTSGGVSMGTRDLIKPLLAEMGVIHFGRVASKPGKPVTFATVNETLVFGLPGSPVSSLVSFELFVRPTLRRLQGDSQPERPWVRVVVETSIRPSPDRPELQRVVVVARAGRLYARSLGNQISTRLLSMRGANALLMVPAGEAVYPPGAELEALLIGQLDVASS